MRKNVDRLDVLVHRLEKRQTTVSVCVCVCFMTINGGFTVLVEQKKTVAGSCGGLRAQVGLFKYGFSSEIEKLSMCKRFEGDRKK